MLCIVYDHDTKSELLTKYSLMSLFSSLKIILVTRLKRESYKSNLLQHAFYVILQS